MKLSKKKISTQNKELETDLTPEEAKTSGEKAEDNLEEAEDLEAVLNSNLELDDEGLQNDDLDFVLNSPLSRLFDETDDLNLFNDMMIQSSASHFQHPRQPTQNYPHCVNGYRQNNYQVSLKDNHNRMWGEKRDKRISILRRKKAKTIRHGWCNIRCIKCEKRKVI